MKRVNIYKAMRTVPDMPVESVSIVIEAEIHDFKVLADQDFFMEFEADQLEKALYFSLPGGTYDRLLSAMLTRKASHFRVAHDKEG